MGNVEATVRFVELENGVNFSLHGIVDWFLYRNSSTITSIQGSIGDHDEPIFTTFTAKTFKSDGVIADGIEVGFTGNKPILAYRRFIVG